MQSDPDGPWSYQQVELGWNYRMTDIQAALGYSQAQRLDSYVSRRHVLAKQYDEALADFPLIRPFQNPDAYSAFHLYVVQVDPARTSVNRSVLFSRLRGAGIGVNVHYIPVHTQPYYRGLGFGAGDFPVSESFYSHALSLPLYPTMNSTDQQKVIDALQSALK